MAGKILFQGGSPLTQSVKAVRALIAYQSQGPAPQGGQVRHTEITMLAGDTRQMAVEQVQCSYRL
jgi:hypothetical protein